jgi:NDP-sugar pyrophosphorylase family protein
LWPVAGKTVLHRLLVHLHRQGVDEAVICTYGDARPLKEAAGNIHTMQIEFLEEPLPAGNAGCVRDAHDGDGRTLFLVLQAATTSPPNVAALLAAHRVSGSHLTVMLGTAHGNDPAEGRILEMYVCDPEVIAYMPGEGYCDIKEGLIPAMVRADQPVGAKVLSHRPSGFRDRESYLSAVAACFDNVGEHLSVGLVNRSGDLWQARSARLAPDVITHGPVMVLDRADIAGGTVLFGPTIIESDVAIGPNTVVDHSVIWSGAAVGSNCRISRSIIDRGANVPAHGLVHEDVVIRESADRRRLWAKRIGAAIKETPRYGSLASRGIPLVNALSQMTHIGRY